MQERGVGKRSAGTVSRRIGENGGCERKGIDRERKRESERDAEKMKKREREAESIRLFVWTEDLKTRGPVVHTDRTDRENKKKKNCPLEEWRKQKSAPARGKRMAHRVKRGTEADSGGPGTRGPGRRGHPFAHAVLFLCPVQVGEGQRGGCR